MEYDVDGMICLLIIYLSEVRNLICYYICVECVIGGRGCGRGGWLIDWKNMIRSFFLLYVVRFFGYFLEFFFVVFVYSEVVLGLGLGLVLKKKIWVICVIFWKWWGGGFFECIKLSILVWVFYLGWRVNIFF